METDWAENRAEMPPDFLRSTIGKFADLFYTTYKREKFHTRIERGTDPGTVDIYISSRVMEQVPTAKIDNSSPAAFAWALLPPNPGPRRRMARPADGALRHARDAGDASRCSATGPGGTARGTRASCRRPPTA